MTANSLVPSARLLWLIGLAGLPAATLVGAAPTWTGAAGLVLGGVVAVALVDAWRARGRLRHLTVEAPPIVHGSKGRSTELTVSLGGLTAATRVGLSLPDAIRCEQPVVRVEPPGDVARWELDVLKRGRHRFDQLYVEAASPLGLWWRRGAVPLGTELHIYPDLRRARAGLAAVFLNRAGAGTHARTQAGKGREFDHLRDYAAGDDFGDIHWKSTARRGFPVTKTFQIERTREVYAVVDHSRLSARPVRTAKPGTSGGGMGVRGAPHAPGQRKSDRGAADTPGGASVGGASVGGASVGGASVGGASVGGASVGGDEAVTTSLECALESALALGLAAERQHDRFGLVTFADRVTGIIRAGAGRGHYGTCRNALCHLESRLVAPDFEELFVFLRRTLTRRSLIVIFTDLSDPLQAEAFVRDVRLIARHHLVLVSMIRPEHAAPVFSRATVNSVDAIYCELAGHFVWHDLQEVATVLARQGVRLSLPDSAALTVDVVSRYMEVKNRQTL